MRTTFKRKNLRATDRGADCQTGRHPMLQAEIGRTKVTAAKTFPARGHLMLDFTMSSSDGRQVSLYDYRGRSNLVLFVAGRAQDSAEDPLLSALSKRYREITDTDSEALAVMADSVGQAEEFRRKMHFPFPVPSDPDMWVHNVGGRIKRMCKSIALLGEYTPTFPPHPATNAAIEHSRHLLGMDITATWVSTKDIDPKLFEHYSGIWVAPGSPYKSMEKTLWAIRYARENNIPCFGTCGGFQHIVIEYARNVLGFKDAQHAEYDPYASSLFISQLACSLAGREMRLSFVPGSRVATIYGGVSAKEQYYCNFRGQSGLHQ